MKKYTVIYVDPPWPYDNPKDYDPAMGGYTYRPMTIADICALPVKQLAAKHCALFLWATYPKLPEALQVIEAWQFQYTTVAFTWVKQNPNGEGLYSGLGHWTNGNAEICLFAKQGRPVRFAQNVKQIVMAPRGRHSEKPAEVRERIAHLMGPGNYIELFAREKVEGWDAWGNEPGLVYDLQLNQEQWTPPAPCPICDGPIIQPPTGRKREYCSRSCQNKSYQLRRK